MYDFADNWYTAKNYTIAVVLVTLHDPEHPDSPQVQSKGDHKSNENIYSAGERRTNQVAPNLVTVHFHARRRSRG